MRTLVLAVALVLLIPGMVLAKACPPPPGQYDLVVDGASLQQICLEAAGTWYGTTFPGWSGQYVVDDKVLYLFGNYQGGAGNDTMVFGKCGHKKDGTWIEWRDGFSFVETLFGVELKLDSPTCSPVP